MAAVIRRPSHASILQLNDHAVIPLDRNATLPAGPRVMHEDDDLVRARIDQLHDLPRQIVELLGPEAQELDPLLATAPHRLSFERPSLQDPLVIASDEAQIEPATEVALVKPPLESSDQPPHNLDVLLRHRLLLKPGGFEGLVSVEVL